MRRLLCLLAASLFAAHAQHEHHATPAAAAKPVELWEGLGNHTHPIRTSSELAQKFFDQGLALIYGFNHDEAARLFGRAAELAPDSPMPQWGIALALGPNYNLPPIPEREERAWAAIEKARQLAKHAPERERDYVVALLKRYSRDPQEDRKQLAVRYKDAMKELMRKYPDDLDAATLYAESLMNLRPWALWTKAGEPEEGTLEILSVLETVLRRYPEHPGANHYYIHAIEASKNPERALPSANRLGSLMPGAGHMVHMPSHIYIRTGDHELSAKVNEVATDVDRRYLERSGVKGIYVMYYAHNIHFVSYARMMQGRFDPALDWANRLKASIHDQVDSMPMLGAYAGYNWMVLTRFGKWDEMLAQPEPEYKNPFVNAMYRYARGVAFAGKKKVLEAQAERERAGALYARIPADETLMINTSRSVLELALADLDARICRAKGDSEGELAFWRKAVELQDNQKYMEPPEWHYPTREALGGALLRKGDAAAAESVFRADLEEHPRNGRSLFGLLKALEMQNKTNSAEFVKREFKAAWTDSPLELSVNQL